MHPSCTPGPSIRTSETPNAHLTPEDPTAPPPPRAPEAHACPTKRRAAPTAAGLDALGDDLLRPTPAPTAAAPQIDKALQRKLDDAEEARDAADRECRHFWAEDAARAQIAFGKHFGLSRMELFRSEPSYVEWVLDKQDAVGARSALREWLLRARAAETRRGECQRRLRALAPPPSFVPTKRLRASTARGQLAELHGDLLECVARHGDLRGYLRLAQTCKPIAAALRPGRVQHVAALATTRNFERARRCLRIPSHAEVADRAELERVGELVRRGLREELHALSLAMSTAHPEFTRRRSALRRATTAAEYGECSDERILAAKAAALAARTKVTAIVDSFHQLCAQRQLRFAEVPADKIKSEATFKAWTTYFEDLTRRRRTPMPAPQM